MINELPDQASSFASQIDAVLNNMHILLGVLFVISQAVLIYFLIRFRKTKKNQRATWVPPKKPMLLVMGCAGLLLTVDLVIEVLTKPVWDHVKINMPENEDLLVRVIGYKWSWRFQYAGPDGELDTFDDFTIEPTTHTQIYGGNTVHSGKTDLMRTADPAKRAELKEKVVSTKRDEQGERVPDQVRRWFDVEAGREVTFSAPILRLPKDRVVKIMLESDDVLHAFFVPEFRLKQDCTPGRSVPAWVKPTKITKNDQGVEEPFTLACAELCGISHTDMKAPLLVLEQDEFDTWFNNAAATALTNGGKAR